MKCKCTLTITIGQRQYLMTKLQMDKYPLKFIVMCCLTCIHLDDFLPGAKWNFSIKALRNENICPCFISVPKSACFINDGALLHYSPIQFQSNSPRLFMSYAYLYDSVLWLVLRISWLGKLGTNLYYANCAIIFFSFLA